MTSDKKTARKKAMGLFEQAYRSQTDGEFGDAIELYKRSIAIYPTAEAYTFLGWTYSLMGRTEEAIGMCQQAIKTDPDYGNPYNDIGAYLIDQEKWEEAIPWLEKAIIAPRYETRQFPFMNLGRVYQRLGRTQTALRHYKQALAEEPFYMPATWAMTLLLGRLN